MRLQRKSFSRITLHNLLRRRRSSLDKFVKDNCIVTYDLLVRRCDSMGVLPPTQEEFLIAAGNQAYDVSSPTEGIVVLLPPDDVSITKESSSSHPINQSDIISFNPQTVALEPESLSKKKKKS